MCAPWRACRWEKRSRRNGRLQRRQRDCHGCEQQAKERRSMRRRQKPPSPSLPSPIAVWSIYLLLGKHLSCCPWYIPSMDRRWFQFHLPKTMALDTGVRFWVFSVEYIVGFCVIRSHQRSGFVDYIRSWRLTRFQSDGWLLIDLVRSFSMDFVGTFYQTVLFLFTNIDYGCLLGGNVGCEPSNKNTCWPH